MDGGLATSSTASVEGTRITAFAPSRAGERSTALIPRGNLFGSASRALAAPALPSPTPRVIPFVYHNVNAPHSLQS